MINGASDVSSCASFVISSAPRGELEAHEPSVSFVSFRAAVPTASAILSVTNVATGKLELELEVGDNAWAYIIEYTTLPGGAKLTATFTNPHDVILTGLTPDTCIRCA